MPGARPRRSGSRAAPSGSGRACCGASRTRGSEWSRWSREWSCSRPAGWSGSTEGWRRRSRKALASVGPAWDPRAGAGQRRFVALAAASVARPGQAVIVEGEEEQVVSRTAPALAPAARRGAVRRARRARRPHPRLARCPAGGAVAERLGQEGKRAWSLAHGGERRRVRGRSPAAELIEALSFPEAVANELTLRRAFGALLDRIVARPDRAGRPFRKLALSARLVGGGSWRRTVTLREATSERERIRSALGPKLTEIPAPVVELRLEAVELAEHTGQQLALVAPEGEEVGSRLREGLRQVRASAGGGAVGGVVEVAPWSRIPEARALVVPRDVSEGHDGGARPTLRSDDRGR